MEENVSGLRTAKRWLRNIAVAFIIVAIAFAALAIGIGISIAGVILDMIVKGLLAVGVVALVVVLLRAFRSKGGGTDAH